VPEFNFPPLHVSHFAAEMKYKHAVHERVVAEREMFCYQKHKLARIFLTKQSALLLFSLLMILTVDFVICDGM
jgi:hypothetical protein